MLTTGALDFGIALDVRGHATLGTAQRMQRPSFELIFLEVHAGQSIRQPRPSGSPPYNSATSLTAIPGVLSNLSINTRKLRANLSIVSTEY